MNFFKEILRIGSLDYLPTDDDILQAQENLSRVIETRLTFGALEVTIVDIAKRRQPVKCIHCFEDVAYIIICISLSDYDQVLLEDKRHNQLGYSFIEFESVINSPQVVQALLKRYFPDYAGGANVNEAVEYIRSRFMQANRARLPTYFIQHRATNVTADMILGIVKDAILL